MISLKQLILKTFKYYLFLLMPKLDRSYGTSGNIFEQKKESAHYKNSSLYDIAIVFAYLNSVAFNYDISSPPKMDKTIFSTRYKH